MADEAPLPTGKPDAIICNRSYPPVKSTEDVHVLRKKYFGAALGSERVQSREIPIGVPEGVSYVTRLGDQTAYLFPKAPAMHSRHPERRHDWYVSDPADGYTPVRRAKDEDFNGLNVLVGYLKPDDES